MATQQDRTPLLPLTPPSLTRQTTVILADYGGAVLSQRTRTSGAGRTGVRMTLDIKATPLLLNLNGQELGKGPSEAIRAIIEAQNLAISAPASPSTILRRKTAANQMSGATPKTRRLRGATVATSNKTRQRYSGGRLGLMYPGAANSDALGNDSGRLAKGWFVTQNPKEGAWTVNCPANRFNLDTWIGDAASLHAWIARFVSLVPALRDPRSILREQSFRDAVQNSTVVLKLTRSMWERWRSLIGDLNQGITAAGNVASGGGLW